jgi:hypothetical protein
MKTRFRARGTWGFCSKRILELNALGSPYKNAPAGLQHVDKTRRTFHSFPAACTPETVSATSAHIGGRNKSASQRAARKFLRISGARSTSSYALKNPRGFSTP